LYILYYFIHILTEKPKGMHVVSVPERYIR